LISTRHIVTVAAALVALSCTRIPALGSTTQAVAGQPTVAAINQRLASLVATEQAPSRQHGPRVSSPGARFAAVTQAKPFHLAPLLLELAGRYNRAERILHFQSHGFDANFWGALGGGRVRLRYSVRF